MDTNGWNVKSTLWPSSKVSITLDGNSMTTTELTKALQSLRDGDSIEIVAHLSDRHLIQFCDRSDYLSVRFDASKEFFLSGEIQISFLDAMGVQMVSQKNKIQLHLWNDPDTEELAPRKIDFSDDEDDWDEPKKSLDDEKLSESGSDWDMEDESGHKDEEEPQPKPSQISGKDDGRTIEKWIEKDSESDSDSDFDIGNAEARKQRVMNNTQYEQADFSSDSEESFEATKPIKVGNKTIGAYQTQIQKLEATIDEMSFSKRNRFNQTILNPHRRLQELELRANAVDQEFNVQIIFRTSLQIPKCSSAEHITIFHRT